MKSLFRIVIYVFAGIGFVLVVGYIAVELGLTKTRGVVDTQRDYFQTQIKDDSWTETEEWTVLKEIIQKEDLVIAKVAQETGLSPRLIVTPLVVEQLRLFYSNREIFKEVFAPLKVLGNQSQFSWGVLGIKQDTARQIESNLKNPSSPWYLGKDFEHALDFKTDNPDNERFERLTDEESRYYSYLYAALFMKQIMAQWEKAGFPIADRPDIIATLYNIGFENSRPNKDPKAGGAEIEINKTTYSFGGFAQIFFDSKELMNEFPR
ncbi:MAG: hypothetical protein V4697_03395 [Patescibacteria group bacterium]